MDNELDVGARRHGNLVDFDPSTPPVSVVLERTEDAIEVTVPWADFRSYYSGWFVNQDDMLGTDEPTNSIPRRLLFEDRIGRVLLVDCWSAGFTTTLHGPGTGQIRARFAVTGVNEDLDFSSVNGIRWEISGLTKWLGTRSVNEDVEYVESRGNRLTVTAEPLANVAIPGHPDLSLIPTWTSQRGTDSLTIRNLVQVEIRSETAVKWTTLQGRASALRDLLIVSLWRPEAYRVGSVLRDDDPIVTLDGKSHGPQWRTAVAAQEAADPEPIQWRPDLIPYSDIGVDGIAHWLELRETFARALDPILSTRALTRVTPITLLAQAGPGLEALGYLLNLRDGKAEKKAAWVSLADRLSRIRADLGDVLPFDGDNWVNETVDTYNGLKHANRAAPGEIDVLNRYRESVLAVRAWVALELGIAPAALKERLSNDRQAQPYIPKV